MLNCRRVLVAVLLSTALQGCQENDPALERYARANSAPEAERFIEELASVSKDNALTPSIGRATDDRGHTLRVIEAKGRGVRLWSQNMPLSGQENPATCGKSFEGHPDPGQFVISVQPSFLGRKSTASAVLSEIEARLRQEGYEVGDTPTLCSSLAVSVADG